MIVRFCNWCPNPYDPSPEFHPGGQGRHEIVPDWQDALARFVEHNRLTDTHLESLKGIVLGALACQKENCALAADEEWDGLGRKGDRANVAKDIADTIRGLP